MLFMGSLPDGYLRLILKMFHVACKVRGVLPVKNETFISTSQKEKNSSRVKWGSCAVWCICNATKFMSKAYSCYSKVRCLPFFHHRVQTVLEDYFAISYCTAVEAFLKLSICNCLFCHSAELMWLSKVPLRGVSRPTNLPHGSPSIALKIEKGWKKKIDKHISSQF